MTKTNMQGTRKDAILKAAREVFLEKGFMGSSVSEIIAKANVTHSLLFHHFKNKEQLWTVVKDQVVEEGRKVVDNFPSFDQPLASFLIELIHYAVIFYHKNPDVVKILNWQRVMDNIDNKIGMANFSVWLKAVEHFKESGEISKEISSENVVVYTLSVITSLVLDPNSILDTKEKKDDYIKFVVNTLVKSFNS
ncbi:MAG: TetR/AcrR family transcriptional regulator [Proteobacteria bacterium]|nr:TetR/AcrR family transcriptional regulator [Pseudomonadota bacterium]